MKKVKFKDLKHEEQVLIEMAKAVRKNAFVPYSNYKVGVAVISESGKIYAGCNVESSIY